MSSYQQTIDNAVIESVVSGNFNDPFAVLGIHHVADFSGRVIRTFLPGAEAVEVLGSDSETHLGELQRLHSHGFFEGIVPYPDLTKYRLRVHYPLSSIDIDDPYRFASSLSADDLYLFHQGSHENAYRMLGANRLSQEGVLGVRFTVWAPNARRVAVVGDFNNWDERTHPMRVHFDSGIWELFLPGAQPGDHYKYAIRAADGRPLPLKADPFARQMELRPGTASRIPLEEKFTWRDLSWMQHRGSRQQVDSPVSIYEVHAGSWRRGGDGGQFLNYRELADALIPYVTELGFTHLQLMPINEHPFDGSWGYQPLGMFAPSCRYGSPNDFRYLVDLAHRNNIGVLLDWVPGHFPTDEHGLGEFDGTHLYEHSDPRQGFHPDWKTYIFNYDRPEVCSYLISNAMYWLEEFHIDGLRFDAVASMLYLDYSREDGEWLPNHLGGRENLGAIELLRQINTRTYQRFPDIMMVAEESTAWPGVTRFADSGGLGFGFKWNLGWMNDTLTYMSRDPIHRQYHQNEMTFGLLYGFSENFILPVSHDEVVHGKRSLLEKMPGDDWQKFANLRAYLAFMWSHPGKQLLFMGCEIAQRQEWNHDRSLDWHLLAQQEHEGIQRLVKDLNALYMHNPAFWSRDNDLESFEWITAGEHTGAIFIFIRKGRTAADQVIVACNLTPTLYQNFRFGVPGPGTYQECLNTNSGHYGGTDHGNLGSVEAENISSHGRPCSVSVTLPPLAAVFLKKQVTR
ncbi:MAG: 1,4-alpha-glucan branching protein GlgB [Gammaproteobacteria bacterium]|jgi:1,4-alpha-glucan branching enzyme